MIVGDAVILGSGGGEMASIFAIGDVLETDIVYAEKGGKHINGVWKREANPAWLNLPSTYQQVEYLQSSGNQYIDTGITANQDTSIDIGCKITQLELGFFFGGEEGYNTRAFHLYTNGGYYDIGYKTGGSSTLNNLPATQGDEFTYTTNKNNAVLTVNGTRYTHTFEYSAFTAPYSIWLFALHRSSVNYGAARIYYCKLYSGNTLVRNFVPCYRKSDNKPGMYDTVNGVFYVNQRTGADFTVGADVLQYIDGFEVKNIGEYGTWALTAKRTNRADIVRNVLIDAAELFTVEV